MYSAKINGEPTTFGTSGLLFRSNKVMYDRLTESLWHQFTGEPIVGELAGSGIKLDFFPVLVTTWGEWRAEHPDTDVLDVDTGIYQPSLYQPESDTRATYNSYFNSPDTMFPVWARDDALDTKQVVLALTIGEVHKAYPIDLLQRELVVSDVVGGQEIVVVASPTSQSARVYSRAGHELSPDSDIPLGKPVSTLMDTEGHTWEVTEEALVRQDDSSVRLERLPSQMSFWFGWYSFHPDTEVYTGRGP